MQMANTESKPSKFVTPLNGLAVSGGFMLNIS